MKPIEGIQELHKILSETYPNFTFTCGVAIYDESDITSPLVWIEAVRIDPIPETPCDCCGQAKKRLPVGTKIFLHKSEIEAIDKISTLINQLENPLPEETGVEDADGE